MNMLKTIISIFTSMQLMFMQVVIPIAVTQSVFGTYAAYAEDAPAEETTTETEETTSTGTGETSSVVTQGIQKVFPGMKSGDAEGMIGFILVMVIGFVASRLFMCEKKSADIYIAAAAGAIYLIGELMQLFKSKKEFKAEEIQYETNANGAPDLDNNQTEAFNKQKAGLNEAKSAALNKAKMQKAAGVMWITAAAVAGGLGLAVDSASVACVTGAVAEMSPPTSNIACSPAQAGVAALKAAGELPKPSSADFTKVTTVAGTLAGCGSCGFFTTMAINAAASCTTTILTYNGHDLTKMEGLYAYALNIYKDPKKQRMSSVENQHVLEERNFKNSLMDIVETVANFMIPTANAGLMKLFGGLGAGIAIVLIMKKAQSTFLDTMLGTPYKRAIAFTVIGGLALATAKKNKDVAKKMQERINSIDKILKRFAAFQRTNSAINNAFNRTGNLTNIPLRVGTPIGTSDEPFPCLNTSKDGKCLSTKSAIDQSIANSGVKLPKTVTANASLAGSVADGVAGKSNLTAGAVDGINNLASNAASIDRANRALQDRINKNRKKNGQKAIDFKKEGNKFLSGMQGSLLKALQKNGISGSKALAAVSPSAAPSDFASDVKDEIKKEVAKQSAEATPTGNTAANKNNGFQFNFDEQQGEELKFEEPKEEVGLEGLAEGELEVDDIVQDPSVSIFKVISVRYMKSGYPRVLKRLDDKK